MATDVKREAEKVEEALRHPTQHQPFPKAPDKSPMQGETVARQHVAGSTMKPQGSR